MPNPILTTNPPLPKVCAATPGLYRHYKGPLYEVIDTVRHSETLETLVLYRPLYGDRSLWVRPASMFTGTVEVNGVQMPRFEALPPDFDQK
jgi:hypothetical protein